MVSSGPLHSNETGATHGDSSGLSKQDFIAEDEKQGDVEFGSIHQSSEAYGETIESRDPRGVTHAKSGGRSRDAVEEESGASKEEEKSHLTRPKSAFICFLSEYRSKYVVSSNTYSCAFLMQILVCDYKNSPSGFSCIPPEGYFSTQPEFRSKLECRIRIVMENHV